MKKMLSVAGAAVALVAGSANAALFSFASDSGDQAWTFLGNGGNVTNGTGPNQPVILNIDDDNGPLPALQISSRFTAAYALTFVASTPLPSGQFSHSYMATGSFSFADAAAGTPLLTVNFTNVLFTALGGQASWGTTASLQGQHAAGSTVTMTWSGTPLPGYGLTPGPLAAPRGFSFGLSALNTSGALPWGGQNPGTAVGGNGLPVGPWFAESSFAASAVPAPAGLALLGLAGLVAGRRRRA